MEKLDSLPMNFGDIILVNSPTWVNWTVRLVTQSNWGHSAMYIGNNLYVESDIFGVNVRHVNSLDGKTLRVLRHKKMKVGDSEEICKAVLRHLGQGYDFKALFDLLRLVFTGRKANDKEVGNKKKFICSEIIAKYYYEFGYSVSKEYSYDEIVPYDFDLSKNFTRIY